MTFKDREEYDRSMTPPSPSLLDLEEDNTRNNSKKEGNSPNVDFWKNTSKAVKPPPSKKRLLSRNPFTDEDDDNEIKVFILSNQWSLKKN